MLWKDERCLVIKILHDMHNCELKPYTMVKQDMYENDHVRTQHT